MGVQHTYGTAGATGGGWSAQRGTLQPSFAENNGLIRVRDSWQARGIATWRDRNRWACAWPTMRAGMIGGGAGAGTDAMAAVGQSLDSMAMFECWSCDGEGSQSLKFLRGMVVTSTDVAVSGALVSAYRTSDNSYAGYTDQSRDDGTYAVATQFGTGNHYVTAYKPGSPDVGGTTVNTLTPANIDGT